MCKYYAYRGGSWNYIVRGCQSAFKIRGHRDNSYDNWGFRLMLITKENENNNS